MQPVVAECSGSVCTIIDDIGGGGTGRFGVFEIKVSGHDEKGVDAEEVPWTAKEEVLHFGMDLLSQDK